MKIKRWWIFTTLVHVYLCIVTCRNFTYVFFVDKYNIFIYAPTVHTIFMKICTFP